MHSIQRTQIVGRSESFDVVVENLKKMLVSRDTAMQLKATEIIHNYLEQTSQCKSYVENFILQDICIFLCEASITLNTTLLKNIIRCLKIFAQVNLFYNKSYAPMVVVSMLRSVHFIIKENGQESIILCILYFMSDVFFQVNNFKLLPVLSINSAYNGLQLLELLMTVMAKCNTCIDTQLAVGLNLHSILSNKSSKVGVNRKTMAYTSTAIKICLQNLCQMLQENLQKCSSGDKLVYIFGMVCQVAVDAVNFCNHFTLESKNSGDLSLKSVTFSDTEYKKYIGNSVYATMNIVTEKFKNLDEKILFPNYEVFLELLNLFLYDPGSKDVLSAFAQHLCAHNFLTILPNIRANSSRSKIKWLCQVNLAELLNILCSENLNFCDWNGGGRNFSNYLTEGLSIKETDVSRWPQSLANITTTDATIHALIIYLYFYCLNSSSPHNVASPLLPYLVEFIMNIPRNIKHPEPILKCLWFIFAMADLTCSNFSIINGGLGRLQKAISKMACFLSIKTKDLYTHHPALIIWVYSSERIPCNIQQQVLEIWLEKEYSLPNRLATQATVWCSLVEIIQTGVPKLIKPAADQLKYCIKNYCDSESVDDITMLLWDALPNTLSSFAVGNNNIGEETLVSMLELCSTNVPKQPSLTTVQRSASLLVTLVSCNVPIANIKLQILTEVFCLLTISLSTGDKLVLTQFINSSEFVKFLYDSYQSSDADVSITALKTLSFASSYQQKYNLECNNTIIMDPAMIIASLISESNTDKVMAILQLVHTILSENNQPINKLIMISPKHPTDKYIRIFKAIFFRLQMVCCKESKKESESGWLCLNSMLKYSAADESNSDLVVALTSQPWTLVLIRFYLGQNDPSKCHKRFLRFLYNWLKCLKILNDKENLTIDIDKNNMKAFDKNNMVGSCLTQIANTFSSEELLEKIDHERKKIITNILNVIGSFFK